MRIHYLKRLQANPVILDMDHLPYEEVQNIGCSVEEIKQLEDMIDKRFPQSYKEFLYLAGKENCLMGNAVDYSFKNGELVRIQTDCRDSMQADGLNISKDFWIIASLHNEQFHFFYYDEGENPPVYHYCSYCNDQKRYKNGIALHYKSFGAMINERIPSRFYISYSKLFDKIARIFYKNRK